MTSRTQLNSVSLMPTLLIHSIQQYLKPERPQLSIEAAIALLILALGKICEHKEKIPDALPQNEGSYASLLSADISPPSPIRQSPIMSSHSSSFLSPTQSERLFTQRGSSNGLVSGKYPSYTRNLDVIPGLAYFAIATDIIGNHIGENSLPYVHA